MPGLLYPAYQKLYSALSNLDRFDKEADFFHNISCLDAFFSEYRNVTFVVQSQLKHTEFWSAYERNRDKYLTDHWFVDKRNETIKQQPFRLVKKISLNAFLPYYVFSVLEKEFSVENDTKLDSLFPALELFFSEIKDEEIFFSVTFSFREDNSDIDLFDKLIAGTSVMMQFMMALEKDIGQSCPLCDQLREKINGMKVLLLPRDFLLVNDYVYYPEQKCFERGERYAMIVSLDGKKAMVATRQPLTAITKSKYFNFDGTPFGSFTAMHAMIRCVQHGADIMPAIMVVYSDGTYDLDAFHADIKTTMYRKINEVAQLIRTHDVQEVCITSLYSVLPMSEDAPHISKDRIAQSTSDILVCASIDNQLNEKEYVFDGKAMENPEYVGCTMRNALQNKLDISRLNMFPIWRAFKNKREQLISESTNHN